jgi:hypothetical protein
MGKPTSAKASHAADAAHKKLLALASVKQQAEAGMELRINAYCRHAAPFCLSALYNFSRFAIM